MGARKQQRKEERQRRAAEGDDGALREKRSFHRGEVVNYHPRAEDFARDEFLEDYLLKGWVPPKPVLSRGMRITAFGSCFAANITRHLSAIGFDLSRDRDPEVYISRLGDAMVHTASILGQFQWALENAKQSEELWHGYKAEGYGYDETIRLRTRDVFLATDFFIVTLGLSEVWYDEQTGGTFWRAIPEDVFDPARHKFRVQSFAKTKADIEEIHRLIRTHVPHAKVLFTLSPIPLAATFRPVSCLTANTASKAIIRAALDEFLREHEDELNRNLFYFPSMELVMRCFIDPWSEDERHPESYVIDTVMKVFEAAFCEGTATLAEAVEVFRMFRTRNLRAIAKRRQNDDEERKLVRKARNADRRNREVRREAKGNEARLGDAVPVLDEAPQH
jgi:GSCFA family